MSRSGGFCVSVVITTARALQGFLFAFTLPVSA
jgi:hypothetical protein